MSAFSGAVDLRDGKKWKSDQWIDISPYVCLMSICAIKRLDHGVSEPTLGAIVESESRKSC